MKRVNEDHLVILVLRVKRETLVLLETMDKLDLKEIMVALEHKETKGQRVFKDQRVLKVPLVHLVLLVQRVHEVTQYQCFLWLPPRMVENVDPTIIIIQLIWTIMLISILNTWVWISTESTTIQVVLNSVKFLQHSKA